MKTYDKTLSELWDLAEHEDEVVAETAKMAIRAIQELKEENHKLKGG